MSQDQLSAGGEPYFNVHGVTYQVEESRQLNPFGTTDSQYFAGLKGAQKLSGSKFWFGVFLWAKNQNKQTLPTSGKFEVTDSQGDVFKPTPLKASINPYAWTSQKLGQNDTEPNLDSTAAAGPTDGGLVLFQLPQSAYQNRPLTLDIYAPGSTKPSTVSLDL
ncbi:MAG: hypothetical protein J2O48_03080 [Solirubrobacterales bacterium]|nr:hypothetical protein [Solirubrobacterales bacterium]